MRRSLLLAALLLSTGDAMAVEGGTGAYLLGSRDSLAGIVPPPGTYINNDIVHISGEAEGLSVGGRVLTNAENSVLVNKLSITQSFDLSIFGGTPAFNVNIPYAAGELEFDSIIAGSNRRITDEDQGFGDITLTPLLGWHDGRLHYSAGLSVFLPVGLYNTTTINVPARKVNALSFGKNVVSIQPVGALTYLDTDTGIEVSGAASFVFSLKNDATDYQTAPAFNLELAALQHLPFGLAVGAQGYIYQQLADDSGAGADAFKRQVGAKSLRAGVAGAGPIITYSHKITDGLSVSGKLKYTHEFNGRRRFESDVIWGTIGISF